MKRILFSDLLIATFLSVAAHAEVSDKVTPQSSLIVFGLISGFACFLAARLKPWTIILVAPVPVGFFFFLLSDFWSADPGADILYEMGRGYFVSGFVSASLIPAGTILGLTARYFDRKSTGVDEDD